MTEYIVCTKKYYVHFFFLKISFQKSTDEIETNKDKTPKETKKYITSSMPQTMGGHTGYLTFATLPPLFVRQ